MKKLILLGLVAIGVGVGTTAKAGGFSINVALPRPPFFLPPPPPIVVPAPVPVAGCAPGVVYTPPVACVPPVVCAPRVVVSDCYRDVRPRERVVVRGFDRDHDRGRHFGHDRR